ncbi:MAG: YbgC/FadM family acyl-CoA thioesterase [Sphaerochaetaceae bacterium]|nr:YbgC/FadM family acyl-CoA thioesterase [Sphaerochaetaceae bacterium]
MSSIHTYSQRVYYSDTDAGGIVYHSRYLDFAEHARTEFVREVTSLHGWSDELLKAKRIGFVVKKVEVTYHKPAFLDDLLSVHSTIIGEKRFSVTLRQRVMREDTEIATLIVRAAALDLDTYSVIPLEDWFLKAVQEYLET